MASAITHLDHVIAVSAATRGACLRRWPQLEGRLSVIRNGVDVPPEGDLNRSSLPAEIEAAFTGRRVVLTEGRLVRRKGVAWSVREVLPRLPAGVLYVAAGEGTPILS